MSKQLTEHLKMLDFKYHKKDVTQKKLYVYYGWAKINKIMKKESIMVIYTNEETGPRIGKDGNDGVTKYMKIAYKREQTDKEAIDAQYHKRVYTCYEIYMDSPRIKGSLEAALEENFKADQNNVNIEERNKIRKALQYMYLEAHPKYKEPVHQLELF